MQHVQRNDLIQIGSETPLEAVRGRVSQLQRQLQDAETELAVAEKGLEILRNNRIKVLQIDYECDLDPCVCEIFRKYEREEPPNDDEFGAYVDYELMLGQWQRKANALDLYGIALEQILQLEAVAEELEGIEAANSEETPMYQVYFEALEREADGWFETVQLQHEYLVEDLGLDLPAPWLEKQALNA